MRLGDLYFHHPRIAFTLQTITAGALGYMTHLIQLHWYRENYLLLHIAGWWMLIVLVLIYLAERPVRLVPAVAPDKADQHSWSQHFRLEAICSGDEAWFHDTAAEELHGDMPGGGPLLRNICLRMPDRWQVDNIETSIQMQTQKVTFGEQFRDDERPYFQLDFLAWEHGWRIGITDIRKATMEEVRDFLLDMHRTLETTDGITCVRWYHGDMLEAQMSEAAYELGAVTPIVEATNGT